ncbi:MobV family relaxase [Rhodococcus sp. IEGM1300]
MAFDFSWNTQKNYIKDVKGKEREQERQGTIKNKMIDPTRTHLNYDFVKSEISLYKRVKDRSEYLKSQGSKVQSNSVVMNSNIITIPKEEALKMTDDEQKRYFKSCYEYFCDRYGTENVMSAKVHLDETTPHMHLHFMPVNKENGRLQARIAISPKVVREIHRELPLFLQERGFDVVQASGKKTNEKLSIHEFKAREEMRKQVQELKSEAQQLEDERAILRSEIRTQKMQVSEGLKRFEKDMGEQIKTVRDNAKQEIAMIREETSRFEYDINRHRERLILDTEDVGKELESTKKDLDHYTKQLQDRIDSIKKLDLKKPIDLDLKPNLLNKVTMPNETFLELKKRAELSDQLQKALNASERDKGEMANRNKYLESQNERIPKLLQEKRRLEREVEFLKSVLTKLKETLVSQKLIAQELLDKWVGSFKSIAAFEMKNAVEPQFDSEKEKEGFDWHRENHGEKYQEQKNDMER